jgi:hypothetical protein
VTRSVGAVLALVALVVAFGVVLALAVGLAGTGRDHFSPAASPATLTAAFRDHGLVVCSTSDPHGAHDSGSVSAQQLALAAMSACTDTVVIQLDAYNDAARRDAAARAVEGNLRPRTFGTVYTWHQYTVYLQADDASRDTTTRDRIVAALDSVGAN